MPSPRRNHRAGVEDRWWKTIKNEDGSEQKIHAAGWTVDKAGKDVPPPRKRWRARWVDDQGREVSRAFDRKTDALAEIQRVTAEVHTGTYVTPSAGRATVETMYEQWIGAQAHIKASTRATRENAWKVHVRDVWAGTPVADIQTSAVRTWVADMVVAGAKPATVENALGVLRMVLNLALEDRRIARNPTDGVKAPRREHKRRGYLTHGQVEQLAQEVSGGAEVVRFLAYTGLRWGEMAALRVQDFDMLRRRVNVLQAVAEVKGTLVWSTAKNHERRSVPFPRYLAPELSALMAGKGREQLVFTSAEGEVLRVSTYRPRVFAKAVARLQASTVEQRVREEECDGQPVTPEFPMVTPHDLRHTAASLAVSAGANVKAVQTMLGHKSAALTLDTYADLFPDDLEAVAEALDVAALAARTAI